MGTTHIIGAGISGVTLALELAKRGENVRIFEKLSQPGGLARTENVDGYRFDCGPHLFHTNNQEIKDYWTSLPNIKFIQPNLYGANFKNGRVFEYPLSEASMRKQFSSEELALAFEDLDKSEPDAVASAKNYREYVNALAGKFLADWFFEKYPRKLWGISTDQLSAKFAPRRISIRKDQQPFHSGEGKWAGVIDTGCGTLSEIIENELGRLGVYIEYGRNLDAIGYAFDDQSNDGVISKLQFGEKTVALGQNDVVVMTLPITQICKMLELETQLWFRCLKIVNHVVDKEVILPEGYDWLYFDSDDVLMHRLTLQDSFRSPVKHRPKSILSAEIAYNKNDKIDCLPESELIDKSIKDLERLGICSGAEIVHTHLIDASEVYPGIFVGYEEELSRVNEHISRISNLYQHGAPATYEYADLQVLTAKSIDLAVILSERINGAGTSLAKTRRMVANKEFQIGSKFVGGNHPCFTIAEIGLNHNGNIDIAKQLILAAKRSGAAAAKIQTYKKGRLSKAVRTARYYEDLLDTQESLPDFLDRIIFSQEELADLFSFAKDQGCLLFSTPFDSQSLNELEANDCPAYKISSMDLVNTPLISQVAAIGKPVILSTGMSEIGEIAAAVEAVLNQGNKDLILLHCVSSYPCPPSSANLPMMQKLADAFDVVIGYSDHTTGIDVALASVALGAKVLEKHFTLDRQMDGPDHNFSIVEAEFSQLTASAMRICAALEYQGFGLLAQELETAQNLKRSLFFSRSLDRGTEIKLEDIEIKSPGVGLHPKYLELILGSKLTKGVQADEPVTWDYFNE